MNSNDLKIIEDLINKARNCFEKNQIDEALSNLIKIVDIDPSHSNAFNNIGIIYYQKKEYDKAISNYEKAIEINPNHKEALNNLGIVLKDNNQIDAAIEYFKLAINIDGSFIDCLNNLATCFYLKNKNFDAMETSLNVLKLDEYNQNSLLTLSRVFKKLRFNQYVPEIELSICKIINLNISTAREMGPISMNMLSLNPIIKKLIEKNIHDLNFDINEELKKFNEIPLLNILMSEIQILDFQLESILGKLRKNIILNIEKIDKKPEIEKVLTSLSLYYFINEYIYPISKSELKAIELIDKKIINNINDIKFFDLEILILSFYKRLNEYKWSRHLTEFKYSRVFKTHLLDYYEEKELRKLIPRLKDIKDDVSKKIRKQYEFYPYPRWDRVNYSGTDVNLRKFLNLINIKIKDESIINDEKLDILIAGCGTGQTTVITAKRFQKSNILAIDLSLSSLSYASRKMNELGIKNVNLIQADILDLDDLDKKFHFIESTGVIHHMKDPEYALQKLCNCLLPGGIMKLGLYSKHGRKELNEFKTKMKINSETNEPEKLVSFRQKIIKHHEQNLPSFFSSIDFFSLSGFKDYLLNVHENQYNIDEVSKLLKKSNLEFCGFEFLNNRSIVEGIKKENTNFNEKNLKDWNEYELKNPNFFSKMYQFWCQKL